MNIITWEQVLEHIKSAGFADDEYFSKSSSLLREDPIWDKDIWADNGEKVIYWMSVFWVRGSNEGYYVHVDVIYNDSTREGRLLGKFWDWERAQTAVNFIQYLLNMEKVHPDYKAKPAE